jgi:hypothetical protein
MRHRVREHLPTNRSHLSNVASEDDRDGRYSSPSLTSLAPSAENAQPLPEHLRRSFEPGFGHDFSQVRIYADEQAGTSAAAVDARAYTVGQDIVFGAAQYAPDTPAGQMLIAHELSHVVQQRGASAGSASEGQELEQSDAAYEREADHAATRVMAGHTGVLLSPLTTGVQVQRYPHIPTTVYPIEPVDPIAESEHAQRDATDALDYVNDFYGKVNRCLDLAHGAESTAIDIFSRITSTPDAPDLATEVAMALLNAGFSAVGGWDLIEKGLTRGVFARNVSRLERGLGDKIGTRAVDELKKLGPSERDVEVGKYLTEMAKEGVGVGRESREKSEKAKQDTEAGRSTETANKSAEKSLIEWGLHVAMAAQEQEIAKANLLKLRDDPTYRGRLLEEMRDALGAPPDLIAMGKAVDQAERNYELALYKKRFGPGSGVHIDEIGDTGGNVYGRHLGGGGDSMDRVVERICELQGWPKDELRVGEWLEAPVVKQRHAVSGKFA